jgi:hypothetical protein
MKNTNVLLICTLLTVFASADLSAFKNPFSQASVKFAPNSPEVTKSLPFKESEGPDRELVEQLMPYVLSIRDIDTERALFEISYN